MLPGASKMGNHCTASWEGPLRPSLYELLNQLTGCAADEVGMSPFSPTPFVMAYILLSLEHSSKCQPESGFKCNLADFIMTFLFQFSGFIFAHHRMPLAFGQNCYNWQFL